MSALHELVARWRAQATAYALDGQHGAALLRRVAQELDEALRASEFEELTIKEGAHESGYSASQLRRRFPGRKTVKRSELPRKGVVAGPDVVGTILKKAS